MTDGTALRLSVIGLGNMGEPMARRWLAAGYEVHGCDIAPETILSVFNASSGRSGSSEVKWPKFILPGSYDSGFAARLMLKDAATAAQLARQTGLPSTLADAVVSLWSRAAEALPPGADHTEIARWIAASGEPPSPY
jgi:3-hydroxyisobutyrate dehydrogenase